MWRFSIYYERGALQVLGSDTNSMCHFVCFTALFKRYDWGYTEKSISYGPKNCKKLDAKDRNLTFGRFSVVYLN